jgi:hypothetical protein
MTPGSSSGGLSGTKSGGQSPSNRSTQRSSSMSQHRPGTCSRSNRNRPGPAAAPGWATAVGRYTRSWSEGGCKLVVRMRGNGTWVCFDCRVTVRRPTLYSGEVPCPSCGQGCLYLGTKVAVPGKRSIRAWRDLREEWGHWQRLARERAWRHRVRERHRLEQELANLRALPPNGGRAATIRKLQKKIAEL